jgi:uncharacterized protein YndB with AHSA1/START domain
MSYQLAGDTTLTITRQFNAPPELVWKAWTDPDAMREWIHPGEGFTTPVVEWDLRPGGRYRIVMRAPTGEEFTTSGIFEIIEPPRRISYTWTWTSTPDRVALVTVTFTAKGGGTELRLTHAGLVDETDRQNHEGGWSNSLIALDGWLTRA